MATKNGRRVLNRRRFKGRTKMSVSDENKPYVVKARVETPRAKLLRKRKNTKLRKSKKLASVK